MKPNTNKTNVMRLLDQAHIPYETITYEYDENNLSGLLAAEKCGLDPDTMFKTLVTRGEKRGIIVFCIPVNEELDLKKCAAAAGDKRIEMTQMKELLGLTGYIRGGCSPIGMKKNYPVYIEETALLFEKIAVSAGARGVQVRLRPEDLISYTNAIACEIVK
ncbi:MAG: Cys-tRNA(Pro) deacylase [Lachnospiraceae bacterium]|nr:Cys-tRNA(Pro) deacylase [Lachnospiraceae bacterium]